MYLRSSLVPLKWMKLISGANERINESLSEIRDLKADMIQGNNQYSESYAQIVQSGPIVDDIGTETLHPLISRKFSAGSIAVQIPAKHTIALLRENMSNVWIITAKNSTAMEKEIISMVWKDSGDI